MAIFNSHVSLPEGISWHHFYRSQAFEWRLAMVRMLLVPQIEQPGSAAAVDVSC